MMSAVSTTFISICRCWSCSNLEFQPFNFDGQVPGEESICKGLVWCIIQPWYEMTTYNQKHKNWSQFLGLTLGPVIGAFMYDAGGFCLPFSVTGTLIIMSGFLVCSVTEMPILERSENSLPVLRFLTKPAICGALFTATVAAYTIGTIEVKMFWPLI